MGIKKKFVALSLMFVFLITLASASYNVGNSSHSIEKIYGPSDYLRGWINLSFSNEPGNKIFSTSEGNNMTLLEFLQRSGANFNCNTASCQMGFSPVNPQQTKTFTLNSKETKYVGFVFNGMINSVDSVSLEISSNAGPSCQNQILVDFLDDGNNDFGNVNPASETCTFLKNDGCFDETKSTVEFNVGFTPYCQLVTLSESPGFEVGAWVKKVSGTRNLTISIYDKDGVEVPNAECVLPDATSQGGEVKCNINHLVTESDEYFVCLNTLQGSGDYKIRGYPSANGCGFFGDPSPFRSKDAAYQIFATGKQFAPVGDITILNDFAGPASFSTAVETYLRAVYGNGINCTNGCIVPARISSETPQTITLKNLQANLETTSGSLTVKDFYELNTSFPQISANFQKIKIDELNLSVPNTLGNKTIKLRYDGNDVITQNIEVQSVAEIQSITPKKTFALYPTKFSVILAPSVKNVTMYEWDFGDGLPVVKTQSSSLKYAYQNIGEYDLKVSVTTSSGLKGTKTFKVVVGSPEEIVDEILAEKKSDLESTISEINSMSAFEKQEISRVVDTTAINDKLKDVEKNLEIAQSDADYVAIMDALTSLNIPKGFIETKVANSIVYFPSESAVNLEIIEEIGTGTHKTGREEEYVGAIFGWNQRNLDTKISFKEISGQFEGFTQPIIRIFELRILEKEALNYDYNLFVRNMENLKFQGSYLEREQSGYWVIPISQDEQKVIFSTASDFDFETVPAFISPDIDRLSLTSANIEEYDKSAGLSRWIFFVLILILLFIIALVAYVIMQEWYKRKYETYLFKDRNKLFNIISYIHNSKQSGVDESQIQISLRKAGWNSEQVTYAMNKYAGKRTGMFEIPVDKILNIFGKKTDANVISAPRPQNVSNQNGNGFDGRLGQR